MCEINEEEKQEKKRSGEIEIHLKRAKCERNFLEDGTDHARMSTSQKCYVRILVHLVLWVQGPRTTKILSLPSVPSHGY